MSAICATLIKKKNYNMVYHVIIGGFMDVYMVARVVWFQHMMKYMFLV